MEHCKYDTPYFRHENIMDLIAQDDANVFEQIREEFYPALCSFVHYVTGERYLCRLIALETIEKFSQRLVYADVENYVFELYRMAKRLIQETSFGLDLDTHHKTEDLEERAKRGFIQAELLRAIYPTWQELPMFKCLE